MTIRIDQKTMSELSRSEKLEWLETNGLGGWAGGTVPGLHTRRYHGLLVPAVHPPVGRQVLLSRLDETLRRDGLHAELGAMRFPGDYRPRGWEYIESFEKDLFPTWMFRAGDVLLRKTVIMLDGENTVLVLYKAVDADVPFDMDFQVLTAARDYHSLGHMNQRVQPEYTFIEGVFHARMYKDSPDLFIHVPQSSFESELDWYRNVELAVEQFRGLDQDEDLYAYGRFTRRVKPGESFGVIASTEPGIHRDPFKLAREEAKRREALVPEQHKDDETARTLHLAADQFIVRRGEQLKTIIAGYHWFSDWGRDTMIALPGLCLSTGRFEDARKILQVFAEHADQGMIPNRFPDAGESPEYNTIDATLWFFVAAYAYYRTSGDRAFIRDVLLPVLDDILSWHEKGTRFGIGEAEDGLLQGGEEGTQLTWMDAKVFDWVVTPRQGKAVEINALWYNALQVLHAFHHEFGSHETAARLRKKARNVKSAFTRVFWNEQKKCLFDVVDENGPNDAVRPNQVFALSLPFILLDGEKARSVLACLEQNLLTPYGLRSLDPHHPDYEPFYGGDQKQRDGGYHQGTVWSWLMGPYITALRNVRGRAGYMESMEIIQGLIRHLSEAGLGTVSEIFDAEPPHAPRGCIAQAWGVAELLRVYLEGAHE